MSKCTQFQPHKPSLRSVRCVFFVYLCESRVGPVESRSKFRTSTRFWISLVYFTIDLYIGAYIKEWMFTVCAYIIRSDVSEPSFNPARLILEPGTELRTKVWSSSNGLFWRACWRFQCSPVSFSKDSARQLQKFSETCSFLPWQIKEKAMCGTYFFASPNVITWFISHGSWARLASVAFI